MIRERDAARSWVYLTHFEQFGAVVDAVVMHERHRTNLRRGAKGKPRGFGFVTFRDEEACSRAMEAQFHEIGGRHVEVKFAVPVKMMAVETEAKARGSRGAPNDRGNSQATHRISDKLADNLANTLAFVHVEATRESVDISGDLQQSGMTEPDACPSAVTFGMHNSYSMPMMPAVVPMAQAADTLHQSHPWTHGMVMPTPMAAPITTAIPMPMTVGWVAPIPYAHL